MLAEQSIGPPTGDEKRYARAVLEPLNDTQRRAVIAVVAYEAAQEIPPEWLKFLELTTEYMLAVEEMVDALRGRLGISTAEPDAISKAAVEAERRTARYVVARKAMIEHARVMEARLASG